MAGVKIKLSTIALLVIGVIACAAPGAAVGKTITYSSGAVNVPIPDAASDADTFVPGIAASDMLVKDRGPCRTSTSPFA